MLPSARRFAIALCPLALLAACATSTLTPIDGDDASVDVPTDSEADPDGGRPGADAAMDVPGDDIREDARVDAMPAPGCGNGTLEAGEECDDGNTSPGDGCDAACSIEAPNLCAACSVDSQCGARNACVELPTGAACGFDCSESGKCPEGFVCASGVRTVSGGSATQCVPADGSCAACGDGIIDVGEECDDGNTIPGDGCDEVCIHEPGCGDRLLDPGEECDDGNTRDGDGCSATCTLEAECGDGEVSGGERCDDGNTRDGDGCSATCEPESECGDGVRDGDEQCDDGNGVSGDGCSSTCVLEAVCGDGVVAGAEGCDDGNVRDGDGCSATCRVEPRCGDGNVDAGEECDDGNIVTDDGCDARCQLEPFCGDGTVDAGEECDDGNTVAGDGCGASCRAEPVCGNGRIEDAEECDDGNRRDGDGCSASCRVESVCGNGRLERGEACDDGNTRAGDGCGPTCAVEGPAVCGNGAIELGEECDNGAANADPGPAECRADCTRRTCAPISLGSVLGAAVARGSNVAARDDVSGGCYGGGGRDAVYRWTAPQAGRFVFETAAPATGGFDTGLFVSDGAACYGRVLACDDDGGPGLYSRAAVDLAAGQSVVVGVDGFSSFSSGEFVLGIREECGGIELNEQTGDVWSGALPSRASAYSASCGGGAAGADQLFHWTAPSAGVWTFTTVAPSSGSGFDTVLHLRDPYSACTAGALGGELACDDDGGDGLYSSLSRALQAGERVAIVVDAFGAAASGNVTLRITRETQQIAFPVGPETLSFPAAGDVRVPALPILPWVAGNYIEGTRSTARSSVDGVSIRFPVTSNLLSCDTQDMDVLLNGTRIGSFSIAAGQSQVDASFSFPPIVGPSFTLRYQTSSTVDSGCGSAGIGDSGATFTLLGDRRTTASGGAFWTAGDSVVGTRRTSWDAARSASLNLVLVNNTLSCGTQEVDLRINDVIVGHFAIQPGETVVTRSFNFPRVSGPVFTLELRTTATVASGCGSAGYANASSYVILGP